MLIAFGVFGICLQSFGQPVFCSQIFSGKKSPSMIRKVTLPSAFLKFDDSLYWKVRASDLNSLSLSEKELKRLEVKLGLIDRVLPSSSEKWRSQMDHLNPLMAREMNSLVSQYSLRDLQDPYLRQLFITQLYILGESPWIGFKKSIEIARRDDIQAWLQGGLDEYILNYGLHGALQKFKFLPPTKLAVARLYLKKVFANGWAKFPWYLPVLSKNLDSDAVEKILWEGPNSNAEEIVRLMRDERLISNYNQFSRFYQRAGMAAMAVMLYYLIPQMQDQFEKELQKSDSDLANTQEKVKERNEAFEKAMRSLEQIDDAIDQLAGKNQSAQMYEETLALFESINHRAATLEERRQLRMSLGLSE